MVDNSKVTLAGHMAASQMRRGHRVIETQRRSMTNQTLDEGYAALQKMNEMTVEEEQAVKLRKAHETIFSLLKINAGLDSTIKHITKNWGEKQSSEPDQEVQEVFEKHMGNIEENREFHSSLNHWIDDHLERVNPVVKAPDLRRKNKIK